MHIELIFLGTSAAVPSIARNHASILLRYFDELILFDCGEGTQRQIIKAGKSFMKIRKILITHYHGDHFLGLAGLLQTMSFNERKEPLTIYAPKGAEEFFSIIKSLCGNEFGFDVEVKEISSKTEIKEEKYRINFVKVEHSALTYGIIFEETRGREFVLEKALALGLKPGPLFSKLQRGESVEVNGRVIMPEEVLGEEKKGVKLVYSSDTRPCKAIEEHAKNAFLIHDATFGEDKKDRAVETMHSTAFEAGSIAKNAEAKKLFLFHISPRYENASVLLEECKKVFENAVVAKDLMSVSKFD